MELDGQPLELPEGEILLGRSRSCTVTLPDPSISRQHAKLMLRQGQVRLRDLNSSNGTYINDTRVQSETEVVDGDRIVLGETEMRFRAAGPEEIGAATQPVATVPAPDEAPDPPTLRRVERAVDAGPSSAAAAPAPVAPPAAPPRQANSKRPTGELLPSIRDIGPSPRLPPPRALGAKPKPGAAAALAARPAGFWIRGAALLLDGAWIGLLSAGAVALPFVLDLPASLASALPVGAGVVAVSVVLVGWAKWGTTPGKRLLGLYVCPLGAEPGIGFGRAVLRWIGYFLSGALLGVGFLLVAFSKDKRGLHDLIAGTLVIRR